MPTPILTTFDACVDATFAPLAGRRTARRASEEARAARIAARYDRAVERGEDGEDCFEAPAPDC